MCPNKLPQYRISYIMKKLIFFVPVTIIWIDICLAFLNLKMKGRNENCNNVNLEEILFKINEVIVWQLIW